MRIWGYGIMGVYDNVINPYSHTPILPYSYTPFFRKYLISARVWPLVMWIWDLMLTIWSLLR